MLVYVSGPYSAGTDEGITENIERARGVAIALWDKGHYALTPHLNTAHFERDCKADYRQYMAGDLAMLSVCDAMVMVPGWETSAGAREEWGLAKNIGLPVYVYPDLPPLHPTDQAGHGV